MPPPSRAEPPAVADLAEALRTMAGRFGELALSVPDPGINVPATPSWSVADVVGHVAMEPARYRGLVLGRGDWPAVVNLPAFNAEQVRALPTCELSELAATLRAGTDSLVETVASFGERPPLMNFDGDQRIRSDLALGTLLGEFIVHGRDVAHALGRPWWIAEDHVRLVMAGLHQILPGWVDAHRAAGHTATYELRLRGHVRYFYAFRDGRLSVDPADPGKIDACIGAEPVTALLMNYASRSVASGAHRQGVRVGSPPVAGPGPRAKVPLAVTSARPRWCG